MITHSRDVREASIDMILRQKKADSLPALVHMAARLGLTTDTNVPSRGHFAAWEQPEFFVSELRASFTSLREPR